MNYKFDFSDFHGLDILKGHVQMKTGVSQTQALRFVAGIKSLLGVDLPTSIIISSPMDFHDEDAESPVKIIVRLAHGEGSITMDATVDFDCVLDPAIFSRVSWDDFLSEVKKHRKMIGEVKMSLLHMDPKETHSMSTGDIFA